MKINKTLIKLIMGIFLMSLVNVYATNNKPKKNITNKSESESEKTEYVLELNNEYVNLVYENSTQNEAEFLSGIISKWDVRNTQIFDSKKKDLTVVFKSTKGFANVTYDEEGRIKKVKKHLNNVVIPSDIYKKISDKYEDCIMIKNKYKEIYKLGDEVKKYYVIILQNGNEKKRIRVEG